MEALMDFRSQDSFFGGEAEAGLQYIPELSDQGWQPPVFGSPPSTKYQSGSSSPSKLQRSCSEALSRTNSQTSLMTEAYAKDLPYSLIVAKKKESCRVASNQLLSCRPHIRKVRKDCTRPLMHQVLAGNKAGSGFGSPIHGGLVNISPGSSFTFDSPNQKSLSHMKTSAVASSSPGISIVTSEGQFFCSGSSSVQSLSEDELARPYISSSFKSINSAEELLSPQSDLLCSDGSVSSEATGSPDVCDLKQLMDFMLDENNEGVSAKEPFGAQFSTPMAVLSPGHISLHSSPYCSPLEQPSGFLRPGEVDETVQDDPLDVGGHNEVAGVGFHDVFENKREKSGLSVETSLAKAAGLWNTQTNNCNGLEEVVAHSVMSLAQEEGSVSKAFCSRKYSGPLTPPIYESWLYSPPHQAFLKTKPDAVCVDLSTQRQHLKKLDSDYNWEHGIFENSNVGADIYRMQEICKLGDRTGQHSPRLSNAQENILIHHLGQFKDFGSKGEMFESPFTASLQEGVRSDGDYDGIRLVHLLIAGAEAVATRGIDLASVILVRLKELVSFSGSTMQRVAACFSDGLQCRIERGRCLDRAASNESYSDTLAAFQILHEISPYIKFGHLTANQAILEAIEGEKRVHIVDYEIMEGIQWPALMQALVTRKGGPPHLRITALCRPHTKRGLATVQETGKRLMEFAASLDLPFAFSQLRVDNGEEFRASALRLIKGEALVVNCMLHLPHMPYRTATSVSSFLQGMRKLYPVILTLVEEELGCNTPAISSYFFEALHHYSAFFDSLEACLASETVGRMLVEKVFLAPRITSAVTFCGVSSNSSDLGADFTKRNWCSLVSAAGFKSRPLSFHNLSQARLLVGLFRDGFKLDENGNRLRLGWRSKALIAASAWN